MTRPDAWARINDLFHRALDRPPHERRAFLEGECGGDAALVLEVSSLLDAHEGAGAFLEPPSLAMPVEEPVGSLLGRTVGHYRVQRVLGEGGMGVVYLAEDTRLIRPVALKALPARYTRDETSRQRLRREARAAAALAHPGIAAVYALEEFDGDVFVAFEFVPGETLRTALGRGPLPVPEVVATARALAAALMAAHERGIVHRDLKPENVVRTPAGEVKILDFGLARFREPSGPDLTLTAVGSLMGTPAHMSPEQIRGEPVDARSDLFSLGVMLYELATGVNPFRGADHAATIANILEARPPRMAVPNAAESDRPRLDALERIVARLLERSADVRFQSARDLIEALDAIAASLAPAPRAPATGSAPTGVEAPAAARSSDALWWWKFHQAAASVTYLALLAPLWFVHEWTPGVPALLVFLAGLMAGLAASLLRWHLWFTIRSYPDEWPAQRQSAGRWIALADIAFAGVLLVAALTVLTDHSRTAAALVAAAVIVVLSFAVIEPATTRAAFDRSPAG